MSAQFLIVYAGGYLDMKTDVFVTAKQATVFTSESDAWYAAYKAGLNPLHCNVVSREAALEKEAA